MVFPKAHLIGEQHPRMQAAGGLGDDGELVGNQIDARAGEAARRRLADPRVPFERLDALVEIARMVAESGEQAFFRPDEAERV